ncbi:MAG: VanZ family protein, partial [Propionicimonas sp.]|nr:VanZ family protein [Propionicimonas sp.]
IELAQAVLLPGRVASVRDVVANSIGVALGVALASVAGRRRPAGSGQLGADPSPPASPGSPLT